MGLKTLLVCLTTPKHAETLMKLAVPLARKHNAHLIGLHTVEALQIYPGIAMYVPQQTFAAFNERQKKEAEEIKSIFSANTENEEFPSEFRLVRAAATSADERMVESARAADLVIMSQEDREVDRTDQRQVQIRVIRESGRPVVVVPLNYDGPTIGENILLGWSETREATRAAHDLLTLTSEGAEITVLRVARVADDAMKDSDGIELAEMYSRHGLKPILEHRERGHHDIAEMLNQVAFEKGADLIVTGALGHSKAYDFVIGATTYALLKSPKLPVLFSK